MKVPVGISNKHVHLTEEDYKILFGKNELTKKADLKQPHNYAACEMVNVKTEKSELKNLRILGPFRSYSQVELAATDARILGINPPTRMSGDIENSALIEIVGPCGSVKSECAIVAQRHIHITQAEKDEKKLPDVVSVIVPGEKGGIIGDVHLKVSDEAYFEMHLDTDEANAFRLSNNQELEIKF